MTMTKFAINTECGLSVIDAETIEQAMETYERTAHYDFAAAAASDESYYRISDDETGEIFAKSGTAPSGL